MNDYFTVRIMSPVALVWEVDASSLSAENREGPFDILPDHARFLSLVGEAPLHIELADGSKKSFTFKNAMIFFQDNVATVYIQEALQG